MKQETYFSPTITKNRVRYWQFKLYLDDQLVPNQHSLFYEKKFNIWSSSLENFSIHRLFFQNKKKKSFDTSSYDIIKDENIGNLQEIEQFLSSLNPSKIWAISNFLFPFMEQDSENLKKFFLQNSNSQTFENFD